ncbi:MAG TPA: hypothetical protein VIX90_00845 [Edaphobacter sp.]
MAQFVKGPRPYCVVLCTFTDIPIPAIPISKVLEFVAGDGSGGLFDYWRDISYGQISLEGSQVFGWYPMQYSWVKDSNAGRDRWIAEAIRLATLNQVPLSRFYGVIAVVNAETDDSASGNTPRNLAIALPAESPHYQYGWAWCGKCSALAYSAGAVPGPCIVGGVHDHSSSMAYALSINDASFPGQEGWRWCRKCQILAYAGAGVVGPCLVSGTHDHSNSGQYRLAMGQAGFRGQDQWQWCSKCQGFAYSGQGAGPCVVSGTHDHSRSANYTVPNGGSTVNTMFVGHESGHTLGLQHSWAATPDKEYGDPWDLMSAFHVQGIQTGPYSPSGPGLNAPTLNKLGWLAEDRILTHTPGHGILFPATRQVKLGTLNRPETNLPLMIRVLTPDRIYTVEFRQKLGWDRGMTQEAAVFIHELRSYYTHSQQNWRWCERCLGLHYAGLAPCAAGGLHDLGSSANYRLSLDDPSTGGQDNWRWCSKCQLMAYAGSGASGPCPAGGTHDHHASGDYRLATAGSGQDQWKWCRKCQGLSYVGGENLSACSAGGIHDHTNSLNYLIPHDTNAGGQEGWRYCGKCQGMAYSVRSICPAGGPHVWNNSADYALAHDATAGGQINWFWCSRCMGAVYGGTATSGVCPAGNAHTLTQSLNYRLMEVSGTAASINGQPGWRRCGKCQGLFSGPDSGGQCPATGHHEAAESISYILANWESDTTYLIGQEWLPSSRFHDSTRDITITVDAFDKVAGIAIIGLSGYELIEPGPPP